MPQFGIVAGCGSLGHGLPMAVGLAYALTLQKKPGRVFVLVGDGECQEGSTWEAAQFASQHQLANLTLIVDENQLQAMDFTERIIYQDLSQLFLDFGWHEAWCMDGDNFSDLKKKLSRHALFNPQVLVVVTTKGAGMPCAENKAHFHYRLPSCAEL